MHQLKLTIKKINSICDFELSWSNNQTLTVQLEYPQSLAKSYKQWRIAYLNYYRQLRVIAKGMTTTYSPEQAHHLLKECHYRLIDEFENWLLHPRLSGIRRQIISVYNNFQTTVNLIIACSDCHRELTRLPWESWDIGAEIGASGKFKIQRTTVDNNHKIVDHSRYKKTRILAIIGSETDLDFSQDKAAIESLSHLAKITFVEQKTDDGVNNFLQKVFLSIVDDNGWDILFFIGHSKEADNGGEFALTPHTILKMHELKKSLEEAVNNGLQLAIFNSCSGIDIADYLIELGLGHVVVMREPINNCVASSFIQALIDNLAQYKDIQTSLADSRKLLAKENIQQKYPSAYLIPSLYRHPEKEFFEFTNWKKSFNQWIPQKKFKYILFTIILLSLISPIQNLLLETRFFAQYLYRQATGQVTAKNQDTAPNYIQVIQIDEESLNKAKLFSQNRSPMSREYLAKLIYKLAEINRIPQTIGIDYSLWTPQLSGADRQLKEAIDQAKKNQIQFVFAAQNKQSKSHPEKKVIPKITDTDTSFHGDIYFYPSYLELPTNQNKFSQIFPFAHVIALESTKQRAKLSSESLDAEVNYIEQLRLNKIAKFNEKLPLISLWFHPVVDYSLAPESVYSTISAWCLLTTEKSPECQSMENSLSPVVIIAAGGYEEAEDNFDIPISLQMTQQLTSPYLTGGEIHAYNIHHILNRHIITPIPDFLVIMLFGILAQGVILNFHPSKKTRLIQVLVLSNLVYIFLSCQLYINFKVLTPVCLPSILLWSYVYLSKTPKLD